MDYYSLQIADCSTDIGCHILIISATVLLGFLQVPFVVLSNPKEFRIEPIYSKYWCRVFLFHWNVTEYDNRHLKKAG